MVAIATKWKSMEEYLRILKKTRLLMGMNDDEILSILKCLNAKVRRFSKKDIIFFDGDRAEFMGIVLSGEIEIQKLDYNGNANIISKLYSQDLIAASACFSSEKCLPFNVICISACEILSLDINRFLYPCCNTCLSHITLIRNMLGIIADKNIRLTDKIDILTKRTIREKLLEYLHSQSKKAGTKKFSVTLTRRQMADYLSVDRSALSRELSRLRNEGLLEFNKNSFRLK